MRNMMLVWTHHQCVEDKTYFISIEVRDYDRNYLVKIPVDKTFISNIVAKMATSEEKGFKYECPIRMRYRGEGLP